MSRSVLTVVVLVAIGGGASAQAVQLLPDPAVEARFRAEVASVSEDAAKAYDEGNAARDAERLDDAAAAYRKAIELAPKVDHPHRRLCSVLGRRNRHEEAVEECEIALSLAPDSPYDKSALAATLVLRNKYGDSARAADLAGQASEAQPKDVNLAQIWCQALLAQGDIAALRTCTHRLLSLDPDGLSGNFFAALVAANDRDYDEAHRRLGKAKAAGLDQATYDDLNSKLDEAEDAEAIFPRWFRTAAWMGLWIVGVWLAVMAILLVAGFALSRITLAMVNRAALGPAEGGGNDGERRLRRIYKAVLLVSGIYFYLSMPLMLATIIAAGVGSVFAFIAMGMIPIKLVVLIGIVVIATAGAILRSLFVRGTSQPPGDPLDLAKHPKLRALLEEVAAKIGTRPVDVAYLAPGTEMAVTERGGVWASLRGKRTERSLIMGVALFDGMTQVQLRSILAHEYGHFRNEDTAGGGFALSVRRSLFALIVLLAQSGVAAAWNPVWWFVRGFHRMYLGISQGASRLQEVLADRWAIRAYGSEAFIAGYRHVVARSVAFDQDVEATIKEVIQKERPLPNLYRYEREAKPEADLAAEIEKEMTREPTAYDSHPSPRQRLEWATQLAVRREPQVDDDAPVWDLFADREELERAMTASVRESIFANHGITIAEAAKPADRAAS